ncbi:MAG: alpha/beta hydrolase [Oscillospiraceae bacterium]|nr:alpha/beta hydrolase [Oscillospiraceae bacterium]
MYAEEMHFIEKGQGEALILLHGNGENSSIFEKFIEVFSKKYHVIAIDTRGHGKSPMGDEKFSLYQFAEDLKDFMDFHKIEKANILGFSDGGNIAMIFASKHPERVIKLIANGANSKPSGMKTTVHLGMWLVYIIASLFAGFSKKQARIKNLYRIMLFEPKLTKEELSAITAPTLVLVGTEDMIKEKESRFIAKTIPEAELCFVLGGHFILKDNFKDYCFAVQKFLDK